MEKWHELWATFSVADHCVPGAFVAEALLYDHLIVPVVPMRRDGLSAHEASEEWQRWQKKGWQPARLNQLVAILGDRVTPIPWTAELQAEWKRCMAPKEEPNAEPAALVEPNAAQRAREIVHGYIMTGTVLEKFVPRMAQSVVAVSQYRSLEELKKAEHIRRTKPAEALPGGSLLAVVGHELLVPEDPDRDDFQLLAEAAEVGADPRYREKRKVLRLWQQEFLDSEGCTDAPSIKRAVEQMSDLVNDVNAATGKGQLWKGTKKFFSFLKVGSKAAAIAEPAGATAIGAALSVGDFALDQFEPRQPADDATPIAAMLVDAQHRLALTTNGDRTN